MISYTGS